MSLPIIQSLWIGAPLSNIEKLCLQSFLDHGHQFHLYTYGDVQGIPNGATIKDGNEILPESKIFTYKGGSYAGFANWFRYTLLLQKGGIWADMDIACIRPFDFTDEIIIASELDEPRGISCTNSLLAFPKGHPLMRAMEKFCREFPKKQGSKFASVGGPAILDRFVHQHQMQAHIKPHHYFLPLDVKQWYAAFDKTFADNPNLYPTTYSVHFYNELLRRSGLDKNARFDPQSLFEQLKTKHRIPNPPNAQPITAEAIQALPEIARTKRKARIKRERLLFLLIAYTLGVIASSLL